MNRRRAPAVLAAVAALAPAAAEPQPGRPPDWKRLDVNGDGRFDARDAARILEKGFFAPSIDVNGDGAKDVRDAWALPLFITRYDRTGDRAVSAEDFAPPLDLALPRPDPRAAEELARKVAAETAPRVPAGTEARLQAAWAPLRAADPRAQAALWEQAGAAALVQHDLDTATWCYARSALSDPRRAPAWSNLGFALAEAGRYREALVALSSARQLEPGSCVAENNLGFVFSRAGKLAEARGHYEAAAKACPQAGMPMLNLAAVKLRQGDEAGAMAAFEAAARRAPGDADALRMAVAMKPAVPPDERRHERDYEADRRGHEEDMRPWGELDVEERIEAVLAHACQEALRGQPQALAEVRDRTEAQMDEAARKILPQGKDACADMKRCATQWEATFKEVQEIKRAGEVETVETRLDYARRCAAAGLAMDRTVLQMALPAAQAAMAGERGSEARRAFEERIDSLYTHRMKELQRQWSHPGRYGPDLRLTDKGRAAEYAPLTCSLAVLARASEGFKPGSPYQAYARSAEKCSAKGEGRVEIRPPEDLVLALSICVVQLEWKPEENEWKLQVGQGILMAGTWSPQRGFGFQYGVGWEFGEGPLKAGAADWVKYGSDGSVTVEIEGTVSAGPVGWQPSSSTVIQAASHEPIGTLTD